jgi:hypothetical protein
MAKKSLINKVKDSYYKAKWKLEDSFSGMNPIKRIGMKKRWAKINAMKRTPVLGKKVTDAAVQNIKTLNQKVMQPRAKPLITQPSPASQKLLKAVPTVTKPLKGPSRPPPLPPSKIPSRPMMSVPKVAPKVPPKPMAFRGNKMK